MLKFAVFILVLSGFNRKYVVLTVKLNYLSVVFICFLALEVSRAVALLYQPLEECSTGLQVCRILQSLAALTVSQPVSGFSHL